MASQGQIKAQQALSGNKRPKLPTWLPVGKYEDDPPLAKTYNTAEKASRAVLAEGFGDMNPRAKNEGSKKVGYTNTYDCDNRKVKDINCKKKIRVIH